MPSSRFFWLCILSDERPTGRETQSKRHNLVLSLTVTALLSGYHGGLSTVCSEDLHLPVLFLWKIIITKL